MNIKVMCVRCTYLTRVNPSVNPDYEQPVVGKVYDTYDMKGSLGYIINGYWEIKTDFIILSEYRSKQLESIGI